MVSNMTKNKKQIIKLSCQRFSASLNAVLRDLLKDYNSNCELQMTDREIEVRVATLSIKIDDLVLNMFLKDLKKYE